MSHNLLDAVTDDTFGTKEPLVKFACSCGGWRRIYPQNRIPRLQEIESNHTQHAQWAGAEELRTGVKPKPENPLEDLLRAMAEMAQASVQATEAMDEFIAAHKEAKNKGMGVVVVRKADGSTTSTANVFVPAGTAVFMDEPGLFVPSGPLEPLPPEPLPLAYPRSATRTIDLGLVA